MQSVPLLLQPGKSLHADVLCPEAKLPVAIGLEESEVDLLDDVLGKVGDQVVKLPFSHFGLVAAPSQGGRICSAPIVVTLFQDAMLLDRNTYIC